ncbi:MAG TPA: hypothetical protein VMU40_18615 [Steroidobacteraceae bacterium]|nr:hypothetical protein [Steroidobacteraceae bacterium]
MSGRVGEEIRQPGIAIVWLEKYAIFEQAADGVTRPLDYMLLAEVLPNSRRDRYEVHGFRGAEATPFVTFGPGDRLAYVNEWLLDRKARSHDSPAELDIHFPNTTYRFEVQDAKGRHTLSLRLGGEDGITRFPNVPQIGMYQEGLSVRGVDSTKAVELRWAGFATETTVTGDSPLFTENTIFFLLDNCRGETVFSSGSGNKREPLSPKSTTITIPSRVLEPGCRYTIFLSFINYRSTDTARCDGGAIAGVAVNSICVELAFRTAGVAHDSRECPPTEQRANYRWPGKLRDAAGLVPWPVDASGLLLQPRQELISGADAPEH